MSPTYVKNHSNYANKFGCVMLAGCLCLFSTAPYAANLQPKKSNKKSRQSATIELQSGNWWERGESNPVVHMIVNKTRQTLSVYSSGRLVSQSNVSTGKKGHETPGGIFSILSKNRFHYSNLYGGAPMPFMQRLTWSGIALHESKSVPDYPASHGCIRMPGKFAGNLYKLTQKGAQVIVTARNIRPERFSSPMLFDIGDGKTLEASNLRPTKSIVGEEIKSEQEVAAQNASSQSLKNISPLRILITRHSGREELAEIQTLLNELKYLAGDVDGWMGPQTGKAIVAFQKDYKHRITGALNDELLAQLYRASGKGKPKNGHVYVRRNQKSLLDFPVILADENTPLGTHHFTAIYPDNGDEVAQSSAAPYWLAVSVEQTNWSKKSKGRKKIKVKSAALQSVEAKSGDDQNSNSMEIEELASAPSSAKQALERIGMPDDFKQKVSAMLTPGSTVIIADSGLSRETSAGTDFIVLTR